MVTINEVTGLLPDPAEVAARLRHAGVQGLVFLDSSGNDYHKGPISIIGAWPEELLCGSLGNDGDVASLREAIDEMLPTLPMIDMGIPLGGFFGSVDFDGCFTFGRYSRLLVFEHAERRWLDIGGFHHYDRDVLDPDEELNLHQHDWGNLLEFSPVSDRPNRVDAN